MPNGKIIAALTSSEKEKRKQKKAKTDAMQK